MNRLYSFLLLSLSSFTVAAQQYRPLPSSEIYQKLQQLNVLGTVMYVAAHPDDENTRLISYLVHHDHVKTIYMSMTRGDGGQNILGNEQGSTLGLIRTHELMEARKIDGAEQLFSHVIDFGFTKSPEETFKFWDKQKLVDDVKAAFETYKPDVIICRFPTTGEGGHGQHTASAIVAGEAFKQLTEAKSKSKHPEDIWVPKRLLFNAFQFGSANTTNENQFKVSTNQFDPMLGEGYGEMAGRSRSVHKSQGAGTPQTVGITKEYFQFLDGKAETQSLYDDIDLSWNRVGHAEIGEHIQQVLNQFDFKNPSASITALVNIKKEVEAVKDDFWKYKKTQELNDIIVSCAGIMIEALTDKPEAIPGAVVPVNVQIISRSNVPVSVENIMFPALVEKGKMNTTNLPFDSTSKFAFEIKLGEDEPVTEPYWLQYAAANSAYQYAPENGGLPEAINRMCANVVLTIAGDKFYANAPVSYKTLDPVKGDVVQRLRIVPAISVKPINGLFIYEPNTDNKVWIRIKAFKDIDQATLDVTYNKTNITSMPIQHLSKGQDTLYVVDVPTAKIDKLGSGADITFAVKADGKVYDRGQQLIQYPHIPDLQYFTASWMKVIKKDWKVSVKKIGYIAGAGDYVDNVLSLSGLDVEPLAENDLNNAANLAKYDAIVLGVRALNTQAKVAARMPTLMQYVSNGGTLLTQYNTNQNLLTSQYGPYPFSITRDRVTDEDAEVTFTDPAAKMLHTPNEITQKDFKGWVQERGIYFPGNLDSHYKTLFSMHDVNEQPLSTAVIYAPYGKGQFIYTSLVFFRELPAGNVGSIRLMMNLLSAGKESK